MPSSPWQEIGNRLRAYRLGKNYTAADLAERIGVSRAALYRLEKGELVKIETLESLAKLFEVSLPSLMGVGVEYYDNAVAFFERMRQLEENVTKIIGNFTPISFLLLSDEYIVHLREMLLESLDAKRADHAAFADYVERVLSLLSERRRNAIRRKTPVVSIVTVRTIERFLRTGLVGRYDFAPDIVRKRRMLARQEVERLIRILTTQSTRAQIGIIDDFAAEQTFQVFERREKTFVTMSPYRLGDHPNISAGIALATAVPEAVNMFRDILVRQWERASKGEQGARILEGLLVQTQD